MRASRGRDGGVTEEVRKMQSKQQSGRRRAQRGRSEDRSALPLSLHTGIPKGVQSTLGLGLSCSGLRKFSSRAN